jgi:hypothetical protein
LLLGRIYLLALSLGGFCLLFRCASQIYPSGGPVDTTPPTIAVTYPEPNTTHFTDNRISFEFSKYVERRSVEESIFISPYVGGELEFNWSGKEVEITFPQKLKENRTYVVTVGTDVVDLRNRNRMAAAFTLAFATGDRIDSGSIAGRVFDKSPEGLIITAYRLDGLDPDTLNPMKTQPDYITQTGKGGAYTLSHLALGKYRVLAIRDEYRILLYVPQSDQYGVTRGDISIDAMQPLLSGVNFQLALQDTTSPQLFSADAPDRDHILLKFSEPVDTTGISVSDFKVADTLNAQPLQITDLFQDFQSKSMIHLLSQDQHEKTGYKVTVENIRDSSGNKIKPFQNNATFGASTIPDTMVPKIASVSPADSVTQVSLETRIVFSFTDAVRHGTVERNFKLTDTTDSEVRGLFAWARGPHFTFIPQKKLKSKMWYRASLHLDSVIAHNGNRGRGGLYTLRFQTVDTKSFGTIEGRVTDAAALDRSGRIFITAENVQSGLTAYLLSIPDTGKYVVENVVEGQYTLRCFRDRNGDGKYGFGSPYPFVPSERFSFYTDTIKVRARWPVDGVNLRLE